MVRTGLLGTVVAASLAIGWWLGADSVRNVPIAAGAVERVDAGQRPSTGELVAVRASFGSDCEDALVGAVDGARTEVLVAIYSLTRRSVTSALARAAKRGVKVEVKYDAKSAGESKDMPEAIAFLRRNKVRCAGVEFADSRAKMHHKFTVIDRRTVLTGSYNYTSTATEVNRENMVRVDSRPVAEAFAAEFVGLTRR
jgi:phosphatidylserine/phosphatidylglycerophosphate/cardiolipin synthase-like enzyme